MGTLAVVQARMSSTRLPGKVLADIAGEPMLAFLLRRLRRAETLDRIVVATSDEEIDDPVAELAARSAEVVRGSRDDVLGRFLAAIDGHDGPVVRITADCPFTDPQIVDRVVRLFRESPGCAYASNIEPRTWPDGLDVECVAAEALRDVASRTTDPAHREHVTLAIRRDPVRYPAVSLVHDPDLGSLRWTVDTTDDLEFARALAERLGERRWEAGMEAILEAVRRAPSLAAFAGAERG